MPVHHLATTENQPGPIKQHFAIVHQQIDSGWQLEINGQLLSAQRAAGCLLSPSPGDRVLAACDGKETWVLCVLERDSTQAAVIETDGDMHVKSAGRMALTSTHDLTLESGKVRLKTRLFEALTGRLEWIAEHLEAHVGTTNFVGRALDSLFDRVSQHCRISFRRVDQLDQLSAGRIDQRAEGDLSMTAENLVAGARHLAKLDGKQIHIG